MLTETPDPDLLEVMNASLADLLEVMNASLISGTFPNSLKTAVVKPLLKKRNLDNIEQQILSKKKKKNLPRS